MNKVLSAELLASDAEKATTMVFGPAMVAIKTYSISSSLLAHLVEGSFRQAVKEGAKNDAEVKCLTGELEASKKKGQDLLVDVRSYEANKLSLKGKLSRLSKEAKEASAKVKELEEELDVAPGELKVAEATLKKAETAAVPELEKIRALQAALKEVRRESVQDFDLAFETAMANIEALPSWY